ncbi:Histone H2A 12 [Hibiscus syriacus]|uniref:Histone H2A 12 n=2 Tax=Hibiscus syriacus TaxID=106335 RepID=A0A6A3AN20_HIBSY|nr:Histone H2A 12 [Hibiscus syriacus]
MDMGSREEGDISDRKQAEQTHEKEFRQVCIISFSVPAEDDEIVTALQRMFSEDSVQSYSRTILLPAPLKLVSALKGSREKQGSTPKKLTVKWAPDVYDPPPTSVLHTVGNRKQQKSKKKKNDKKKNGKKGQKGNNAGRGSGGGKDNSAVGVVGVPIGVINLSRRFIRIDYPTP